MVRRVSCREGTATVSHRETGCDTEGDVQDGGWAFSLPKPRDTRFSIVALGLSPLAIGVSLFGSGTSSGQHRSANVIPSPSYCLAGSN